MEKGGTRKRKPRKRLQGLSFLGFCKGWEDPGRGSGHRPLSKKPGQRATVGGRLTFPEASVLLPSCSFALMVMPRKQHIGQSIFRLLNGKSDEKRKEMVILFICFGGFFLSL